MSSRELGLVLAQQLLDVDDLHYGLWDEDLPLSFSNLAEAQQRYTDMILDALPSPESGESGGVRVLDIGCGTGHLLAQLLVRGYHADGLVPAPKLAEQVRKRLAEQAEQPARLFETTLEQFPVQDFPGYYDVALFSESFQYIPLSASFPILARIIRSLFGAVFRKKLEKHKYKYFSGHRSQAVFERYKTYRLLMLERETSVE